MPTDPLLQPYPLRHLTLRNRLMTAAHEPAYAEDGMPKARYRAYHVERAKAGIALTMTAGSATVSRDSPPAFNNILLYKDEVVGWMRELADACHEHGAAVMIQITHLGRRTRWDRGFWLPVLSASHRREAAHRAFPKKIEDWDIRRIIADYGDAAERTRAAGLDGLATKGHGGQQSYLTGEQVQRLTAALDEGPGAHGHLEDQRWTLARIRDLIHVMFGLRYKDVIAVSRLLRNAGYSWQAPTRRAAERDESAIAAWREESWSEIKGRPRS